MLFDLAVISPASVFYVFPFYVTPEKLQRNVPQLMQDTWLLDVDQMATPSIFGSTYQSRTVKCVAGTASINPQYQMKRLDGLSRVSPHGIPIQMFARWYKRHLQHDGRSNAGARRNPWLVRGLRVGIVTP